MFFALKNFFIIIHFWIRSDLLKVFCSFYDERNLEIYKKKKIEITDEIVLLFLKERFIGQKSTILHQLILNGEVEEVEKLLNKGTSKQYFFHFSYSLAPSQVSKHSRDKKEK